MYEAIIFLAGATVGSFLASVTASLSLRSSSDS